MRSLIKNDFSLSDIFVYDLFAHVKWTGKTDVVDCIMYLVYLLTFSNCDSIKAKQLKILSIQNSTYQVSSSSIIKFSSRPNLK